MIEFFLLVVGVVLLMATLKFLHALYEAALTYWFKYWTEESE